MSQTWRSDWIVVGISGVTCGGKTTLANQLARRFAAVTAHQDDYFYPDDSPHHVRCPNIDHNDYDRLSALDMPRMHADVTAILRAPPAGAGKRLLVMEGFTVLNYKPLAELCDLKYLLTLEYGECRARRALRAYSPPDVEGYFEQCVWPAYCRHRDELLSDSSVRVLPGAGPGAVDARAAVDAELRRLGARVARDD